jgi:chromosome condensin MukBEF complex kleisin-like MukF subunit
MLKEYNPREIFEDIGTALDACQNCLSELKGHTRELRDALESD